MDGGDVGDCAAAVAAWHAFVATVAGLGGTPIGLPFVSLGLNPRCSARVALRASGFGRRRPSTASGCCWWSPHRPHPPRRSRRFGDRVPGRRGAGLHPVRVRSVARSGRPAVGRRACSAGPSRRCLPARRASGWPAPSGMARPTSWSGRWRWCSSRWSAPRRVARISWKRSATNPTRGIDRRAAPLGFRRRRARPLARRRFARSTRGSIRNPDECFPRPFGVPAPLRDDGAREQTSGSRMKRPDPRAHLPHRPIRLTAYRQNIGWFCTIPGDSHPVHSFAAPAAPAAGATDIQHASVCGFTRPRRRPRDRGGRRARPRRRPRGHAVREAGPHLESERGACPCTVRRALGWRRGRRPTGRRPVERPPRPRGRRGTGRRRGRRGGATRRIGRRRGAIRRAPVGKDGDFSPCAKSRRSANCGWVKPTRQWCSEARLLTAAGFVASGSHVRLARIDDWPRGRQNCPKTIRAAVAPLPADGGQRSVRERGRDRRAPARAAAVARLLAGTAPSGPRRIRCRG